MVTYPTGEQSEFAGRSAVADTYAGRVHGEWDAAAPVTPLGQLPFFIDYLKQAALFDRWVGDCPLEFSSPNAPHTRDLLGTVLLSVLASHRRYAHVTALRCNPVNPPLLGMRKVVSEDSVRRGLEKIDEVSGVAWLRNYLDYCNTPALGPERRPWLLRGDKSWGIEPVMARVEQRERAYVFRLRLTQNVKRALRKAERSGRTPGKTGRTRT